MRVSQTDKVQLRYWFGDSVHNIAHAIEDDIIRIKDEQGNVIPNGAFISQYGKKRFLSLCGRIIARRDYHTEINGKNFYSEIVD